jgi:hypothetical protein
MRRFLAPLSNPWGKKSPAEGAGRFASADEVGLETRGRIPRGLFISRFRAKVSFGSEAPSACPTKSLGCGLVSPPIEFARRLHFNAVDGYQPVEIVGSDTLIVLLATPEGACNRIAVLRWRSDMPAAWAAVFRVTL